MRRILPLLALLFLLCLPSVSLADTRALLVACSDFITQPDLGSAISGNVQMIASALLGVSPRLAGLSIEDSTIGTDDALEASILSLGDNPCLGMVPRYNVLKRQGYYALVLPKDLVFYKIDEGNKTVTIHAVADQRQDYLNILRGL